MFEEKISKFEQNCKMDDAWIFELCTGDTVIIAATSENVLEIQCTEAKFLQGARSSLIGFFEKLNAILPVMRPELQDTQGVSEESKEEPESIKVEKTEPVSEKFTITKRLGGGAYGDAHLLESEIRKIVMKTFKSYDDYLSLTTELMIMKALCHANIVRYLEVPDGFESPDDYCIFTEYCAHGSLREVLKNPTITYTVATIALWSEHLFSGLFHLHFKNLVHCDLKPENIMIAKHFVLKIGDLGSVAELPRGEPMQLYRPGTPGYITAEAENGFVDFNNDIYSCGIILWEIVERRKMVYGKRAEEIVLSSCPIVLEEQIKNCCALDGAKRPNAKEALEFAKLLKMHFVEFSDLPRITPENENSVLMKAIGLDGTENFWPVEDNGKLKSTTEDEIWIIDADLSECGESSVPGPSHFHDSKQQSDENHVQHSRKQNNLNEVVENNPELGFTSMSVPDATFFSNPKTEQYQAKDTTVELIKNAWTSIKERLESETIFDTTFKNNPFDSELQGPGIDDRSRKELARELLKEFEQLSEPEKVALSNRMLILINEYHNRVNSDVGLKERYFVPPKDDRLYYLEKLFEVILLFDAHSHFFCIIFSIDILETLNQNLTTSWEAIELINIAINHLEELRNIFSCRLYFQRQIERNGADEWLRVEFELENCLTGYIKRDGSDVMQNMNTILVPQNKEVRQPMDTETLRTELNEKKARIQYYERAKQAESRATEYRSFEGLMSKESGANLKELLKSFPKSENIYFFSKGQGKNQPFPGYIFQLDQPPEHKCKCGRNCEIGGGFPRISPQELQIKYYKCASIEERDFLEVYTWFVKVFKLMSTRDSVQLKLPVFVLRLISEIRQKRQTVGDFLFFITNDRKSDSLDLDHFLLQLSNRTIEYFYRRESKGNIEMEELSPYLARLNIEAFVPLLEDLLYKSFHLDQDDPVKLVEFHEREQANWKTFWEKIELIEMQL